MFQPMPTPYASFIPLSYDAYVGTRNPPEQASFAPTPPAQQHPHQQHQQQHQHQHQHQHPQHPQGLGGSGGSVGRRSGSLSSAGGGRLAPQGHPDAAPDYDVMFRAPGLFSDFDNHPPFHQHHHHHNTQQNTHPLHNPSLRQRLPYQPKTQHQLFADISYGHRIKMEPTGDLAEQEVAARDYKPQLDGPFVGDKTTSHAIAAEYAKADPTYVAKTLALPQTYSHYRPIQGDGNCGWRAIGFGYLESLIRCGGVAQLQAELHRLKGLCDYIATTGGYSTDLTEDFTDVTFDLMEEIAQALSDGRDALPTLVERFNDEMTSAAIIYHLRLLVASWLKGNFVEYEPWVPGDVNSYCDEWILPVNREIDHLGIVLLFNVLLKPANMVLEIAYLDRSEGDEVNVHRMPDEANGKDAALVEPMIQLLYRPGHYDILYRDAPAVQDVAAPPGPTDLQVNRVSSLSHQVNVQPTPGLTEMEMAALAMIPGFSLSGVSPLGSPSPCSPFTDAYTPPPVSPWMAQPYGNELPPTPITPQQPSPPAQQEAAAQPLNSLRFSKYNYPLPGIADAGSYAPEPAYQVTTTMFKNSHFNVAHYRNPHFQPEEYKPEEDDNPPPRSTGRKRSH